MIGQQEQGLVRCRSLVRLSCRWSSVNKNVHRPSYDFLTSHTRMSTYMYMLHLQVSFLIDTNYLVLNILNLVTLFIVSYYIILYIKCIIYFVFTILVFNMSLTDANHHTVDLSTIRWNPSRHQICERRGAKSTKSCFETYKHTQLSPPPTCSFLLWFLQHWNLSLLRVGGGWQRGKGGQVSLNELNRTCTNHVWSVRIDWLQMLCLYYNFP